MNPDPQNQITLLLSSTSISAAKLRRRRGFIVQWRLGFEVLTDEPWRGGAQTVKLRETKTMGKNRRGKWERREKEKKKEKVTVGIKYNFFI